MRGGAVLPVPVAASSAPTTTSTDRSVTIGSASCSSSGEPVQQPTLGGVAQPPGELVEWHPRHFAHLELLGSQQVPPVASRRKWCTVLCTRRSSATNQYSIGPSIGDDPGVEAGLLAHLPYGGLLRRLTGLDVSFGQHPLQLAPPVDAADQSRLSSGTDPVDDQAACRSLPDRTKAAVAAGSPGCHGGGRAPPIASDHRIRPQGGPARPGHPPRVSRPRTLVRRDRTLRRGPQRRTPRPPAAADRASCRRAGFPVLGRGSRDRARRRVGSRRDARSAGSTIWT